MANNEHTKRQKIPYLCNMQVLIFILMVAFIVGIIYLRIQLPTIKGKMGEKGVAATLSFLPIEEYVVLNDLMFMNGSHSTQIDHIVISIHGIFVIETKNYKGGIFGNIHKDYWTQNIWGNKYSLYNPVFQNKNHIRFLINKFSELKERETFIYPIVVFLSASKVNITGDNNCVLGRNELNSYIRSHSDIIMTIDDCRNIATLLSENNIVDKELRNAHKIYVRSAIRSHEIKVNNGICPRCGGRLVLRIGKYGNFYGCSNYPHCRYTR